MAVWPGEKLGLYDVTVSPGSPVSSDDLWALSAPNQGVVMVAAGASFYVTASPARLLLADDVIAECSWFIEVASGDAVVQVSTGVDPGFSGLPVFGAPTTVTVAAGSIAVPLPDGDRTYSRLRADEDALVLRVEVFSGAATLTQLRLQIEPPGGFKTPTGFVWSEWTTPPEVLIPAQVDLTRSTADGLAEALTPSDRVGLTNAALFSSSTTIEEDAPAVGAGFDPSIKFTAQIGVDLAFPQTDRATTSVMSMRRTAYWEQRPDFRATPEHFADDGLFGRDVLGAGPVEGDNFEFLSGPTRSVGWEPFVLVPHGYYAETLLDGVTPPVPSPHEEKLTLTGSFLLNPAVLDLSQPVNLNSQVGDAWSVAGTIYFIPAAPLPGDMTLDFTADLPKGFAPPAEGSWDTDVSEINGVLTWTPTKVVGDYYLPTQVKIRLQMPDYRWKIPTYNEPGSEPRFFVVYEGEDRPVGFGKPDTELAVFGVQTALGSYRDLTFDEYASVDGPLPDFTP